MKKVPDFLFGGGEMGERIRNFDWTKTPLGAPEQWDQSLKTCVRIMLTSSQPIWIGWGKQLIKLYNDPYKAIVGGKHPQALGQPASVVWKDIWKDIEPMLKKVMEKDEGTYVESQLLIMERYGYPEETYYTFSYSPVPGDNGGTAGMICYNTASTERIITERSLQTLQELGRLAKKNTLDEVYTAAVNALEKNNKDFPCAVIYKIDEETNTANAFAFAGINKDHPELAKNIDLNNPGPLGKNLSKAVTENTMVTSETARRWKNLPKGAWQVMAKNFVHVPVSGANKKFPLAVLSAALNPYRKFDDAYKNFVQLVADQISLEVNNVLALEEERKRARALAEIDKAKTLFFTNISHEFRTPLTLMLGPIEEALNDVNTAPATMKRMDVAHRNAIRLLKLVNALLDFSRIESGRQQAQFSLTDIVSFTKNLVSNFRSATEKTGLKLVVKANNKIPAVYLDKDMWEKIVFNLLSNAFKYTLKGSITVEITSQNNNAILKVKDTGVGIPENELPRMFERFHRVQNITGRSFEGTGIGLSLTKELVQLNRGIISVESKQGVGSIFTVTIPFGKEGIDASQIKDDDCAVEGVISEVYIEEANVLLENTSSKTETKDHLKNGKQVQPLIMIVDDNIDMRKHIETLLSERFNVVAAVNGEDALEKLKQNQPELILSDVMMPVMDGIQLLKAIKENKATEHIPVILLTARAGEESKIEGWETGADDYLVKPFSSKELIARISAQISITKKRRAVEQHMRDLFMQAPTAILILSGPDFIYEMVNEAALSVTNKLLQKNFTRQDIIGKTAEEIMPEAKQQGLINLLKKVYETGEPFVANEYPLVRHRDGKTVETYSKFAYVPLRDENGNITGIMVIGDDITPLVIARKKIEESEERFRSMADEAPLFVWVTDENMQTTFINKLGRMYFNLGENVNVSDISWKKYIHPDDIDMVLEVMKNAAEKRQPYTLEMRLKNGETGNYQWFIDKGVPRFENDMLIGFIGSSLNIHDRKEAETAIRESENSFRTLAETLPHMVWVRNTEDGIVEYGSKSWEEYSGIKDISTAWKEMVHPDDWKLVMDAWEKDSLTDKPFRYEVRLKNKQGEYRWHYTAGEPLKDGSGKIVKWIGAMTDIHVQKTFTEKLEQEVAQRTEELVKANKELESFNYIASHDLQEPLRKIQTFIALIDKNRDDINVTERYFEKIRSSAQRMSELIQSILTYTRLSKQDEAYSPTDLNKVLNDVENDFELLIKERGAKIKSSKLPVIKANPLQMHQLFSNLISNSLKFSKEDPEIRITSKIVTGDKIKLVALTFTDNGIGFDSKFKEQIFQLFQRLHGKEAYAGTGIGLSIVKKIVEQHKGYITADSADGKGATFNIWLPVEQ